MSRYARETTVDPGRSRAEIEKTISRYGAGSFGYITDGDKAQIAFQANGRRIRMAITMPPLGLFATNKSGKKVAPKAMEAAHQKAVRQIWRALALVVKAKLEAVESGVATFEQEFLAYTLLPSGQTVGEQLVPKLDLIVATGKVPALLSAGEGA